ncbi:MAG: tetratricopeptide repeat protein, partial [Chloroflexota bacterium]
MTPSELRKLLDRTLTTDSLRVLCHQLKVDYDNLEGGSKQARLVSLLTNLERHGRLYELQTLIENDQLPVITGKLSTLVFPLYNLPSANPHFTGREDLLMELTQNGERIAITQTITGLGGVGKTQLALAYANQQRANFDLIWWLNGSETALLDNGLQQLGQVLGLPLPTTNSIASRQMVLTWLGSCDKQWLLIYDNVDQLQPRKLRTFLPNGQEGCQLLITSRNRHWQGLVTRVVEVTTFAPAEAKRFLTARLGETDKMLLADLAEELGYLPLALEQAVAYMVTGSVSISDYLRLFKTRRQDLWAMERPPDMYHETVATTWAISFEKIQEVRGVPELIALCSILAQDAIPIELLINASAETITLQRTPLQDEIILQEAIYTLNCYSLVHGYANNLAIHPLVQTVYRDRLGIKSVKQWINTAIALLRPYFPDWTLVHKWANGLRLLPHMLAVADLAANIHLENKRTTFLDNWIGFYFKHSGDYQRARPYYERALSATENLFGKDHLNTADILTNLGMLLQAMGLLTEAQIYRKRALDIAEV